MRRRWRKKRNPLIDGWVCPQCGQNGIRHGRGGPRSCKGDKNSPHCPGVVCDCEDGNCYVVKGVGKGWRRSPCNNALCLHCGWRGQLRSRAFEREYGKARCHASPTGWHHVVSRMALAADRYAMRIEFVCTMCGAKGASEIDPVESVEWSSNPSIEREAPRKDDDDPR